MLISAEPLRSIKEVHIFAKLMNEFLTKIPHVISSSNRRNERMLQYIEKSLMQLQEEVKLIDLLCLANIFNQSLRMPLFAIMSIAKKLDEFETSPQTS
jgi:hypothetical protein